MEGKETTSPRTHEAAEGKKPQKGKNISPSPLLLIYTFDAKCFQIFLWTPEILLLGLQEFTEVKLTLEERGEYHVRTQVQVFD